MITSRSGSNGTLTLQSRRTATLAGLVFTVALFAATAVEGASLPVESCSSRAVALSEALEPVIEAVTDGRPASVPVAARKAQRWWRVHRSEFSDTASIAREMHELARESSARHPQLAARAAVRAAISALDGCSDPPNTEAELMRLDLAGMAAWLRAHGIAVEFPRGVEDASREIANQLRAQGHTALAEDLVAETNAALAIPVRAKGPAAAANRLLERVDEVEKIAR